MGVGLDNMNKGPLGAFGIKVLGLKKRLFAPRLGGRDEDAQGYEDATYH